MRLTKAARVRHSDGRRARRPLVLREELLLRQILTQNMYIEKIRFVLLQHGQHRGKLLSVHVVIVDFCI